MDYNTIKIPLELKKPHELMTLQEAEKYFKWFMGIKDTRLSYLIRTIFGHENIEFSQNWLQAMQYFLQENFHLEKRDKREIEDMKKRVPVVLREIHKIPEMKVVEPTISIALDIGIYFSEYLRTIIPGLEWDIEKDSKDLHYARPVVRKPDKPSSGQFCPSIIMGNIVGAIEENDLAENRLVSLIKIWEDNFLGIIPTFDFLDRTVEETGDEE